MNLTQKLLGVGAFVLYGITAKTEEIKLSPETFYNSQHNHWLFEANIGDKNRGTAAINPVYWPENLLEFNFKLHPADTTGKEFTGGRLIISASTNDENPFSHVVQFQIGDEPWREVNLGPGIRDYSIEIPQWKIKNYVNSVVRGDLRAKITAGYMGDIEEADSSIVHKIHEAVLELGYNIRPGIPEKSEEISKEIPRIMKVGEKIKLGNCKVFSVDGKLINQNGEFSPQNRGIYFVTRENKPPQKIIVY